MKHQGRVTFLQHPQLDGPWGGCWAVEQDPGDVLQPSLHGQGQLGPDLTVLEGLGMATVWCKRASPRSHRWGSTKPLLVKAALGWIPPTPSKKTQQNKERAPTRVFFVPSTTCTPGGESGGAELLLGAKHAGLCCFIGAPDPPEG